jgi:hypothetical protein
VVTHPSTSLTINDLVYGVGEVRNWPFLGKKMARSDLTVALYAATPFCVSMTHNVPIKRLYLIYYLNLCRASVRPHGLMG